jgi:hypothetical protein
MRRQAWRPPARRFHLLFPFITISFGCPAVIMECVLKLDSKPLSRAESGRARLYAFLPQVEGGALATRFSSRERAAPQYTFCRKWKSGRFSYALCHEWKAALEAIRL